MKRVQLEDKVAIITGASSGIGKATAIALAQKKVHVILVARRQNALHKVAETCQTFGVKTLVIPTDVSRKEEVHVLVQEALTHFGEIDIFVSNAGRYFRCPVRDLSIAAVKQVMAVNFYGCLYGIKAVLPHMLERQTGHIVIVSSVDGKKGLPPDAAYVASKFAITGFTEVLRQEIRSTGIYVSTIFPGRVDTPMLENLLVPKISAKISAEKVADAIIRALKKRKPEVLVPYWGPKTLIFLNNLSSHIGDWLVRAFHLQGKDV